MKKQKFTDFYTAWWWLYKHPIFLDYEAMCRDKDYLNKSTWTSNNLHEFYSRMGDYVEVSPHKVNPKTKRIEDDESSNTHIEIWIEAGYKWKEKIPFDKNDSWMHYHDINLDCGGDTYEEAIVNLSNLVWKHYGAGKKFLSEKLTDLGITLKESK